MSSFWAFNRAMNRAVDRIEGAAERKSINTHTQVGELQDRVDRAMLVCEALWTLVRDRVGLTEEELIERVNAIDLSDGKLDGKVRREAVACPKCGRTIARRFKMCMYCSQPIMHDPFA